ncbi:MAG: phosphotransferase [Candidatus Nanopelagicales bacterium]
MTPLHDDEVPIDLSLVRALLDEQHPQWSGLTLREIAATGTDHRLFRLGDDLLARIPRIAWAADQARQDARCLPLLAEHLHTTLPEQVALGRPGHGYPWEWSVVRWLPGRPPDRRDPADRAAVARDLGRVCADLSAVPIEGGPVAGVDGGSRGVPLASRDELTRAAIAHMSDELHGPSLLAVWRDAVTAPVAATASWLHGDLTANNLLVDDVDGALRLAAVIDWGPVGVGDAAADAAAAWAFLTADERPAFRAAAAYDDATWRRGRGWALTTAVVALEYYRARSRAIADNARRTLVEVLAAGS